MEDESHHFQQFVHSQNKIILPYSLTIRTPNNKFMQNSPSP